jgi:hypothetical protein
VQDTHVLAARAVHGKARSAPHAHAATGWRRRPCVKAMVSDHAPLSEGRGLLAPRGPPSAGLQASGPSFVGNNTKFNS